MNTKTSLSLAMILLTGAATAAAAADAPKAAKPAAAKAAAAGPKTIAPPAQAGRVPPKTRPSGDAAIIRTEADAMGFIRGMGAGETTTTINRVQLRGSGKMTVNGVTTPVSHYIYTLSLHLKAAREDIQPAGKGARTVRVVLDKDAWDEKEPGVDGHAADGAAAARRLQLARTPFGFTRALIDAKPGEVKVTDGGPGKVTLAFPIDGVMTTAVLNADYRPASISMTVDRKAIVTRYDTYRDLSEYGLMFPTHWTETVAGKPYLDLKIDDGRVASYAVFPKPDSMMAAR
jgi:hypothetical protein